MGYHWRWSHERGIKVINIQIMVGVTSLEREYCHISLFSNSRIVQLQHWARESENLSLNLS